MKLVAVAFGVTGISHLLADSIAPWIELNAPELAMYSLTSTFFWLVLIATTLGLKSCLQLKPVIWKRWVLQN